MNLFQTLYTKILKESKLDGFDDIVASNPYIAKGLRLCQAIEDIGGPSSEALIVGGAVRDMVLRRPINDVDIGTNVDLALIEQRFKSDNIGKSKTFGIINVHFEDEQFEVAHFRQEAEYSDGRHPDSVSLVKTFKGDSERRDFTWNAMGLNTKGEIVDYHNGLDDLKAGVIRTVGDANLRFTEDALRILRLLRFAVKMGFKIDPATMASAKELSHMVDKLSVERIAEEFYKVAGISGQAFASYLEKLDEIGLLQKIIPELYNLKNFQHSKTHHPEGNGIVFGHVMEALKHSRSKDPVTNLAIAFHDLGKGTTYVYQDGKHTYNGHEEAGVALVEEIGKRLKLSTKDTEIMAFCAANHMRVHKIYDMKKSKVVAMVNSPYWSYLKDVSFADEMCRGFAHSTPVDFKNKVEYAEGLAANANKGGTSEELRLRIKKIVDGNKLMSWIPELKSEIYKPFMSTILRKLSEDIVNEDLFEASEQEIRSKALKYFEESQRS